ncbi:50S ribosomal protein L17 [Candidatus Gottesmanbacteria bacterium RIFCSPHIGHO2_02_FULL_39_14]|uniref:50S ribosomal protein L17 n=2 Tax=Candidatus Gottesmaniibacteriota TaxID=1752720 RepID=A0A1F5ZU17_9BACT|nr:MAG: 50S ribosomal protein L17 [Candidatus Gottesmanbacteria bacterium RBG_16_38_7b]OGG15960.1 MAG: 50S ribosomal protein L17 [Candidatus Gottesmanbacteria bacterium RIFCSPHIGHO2_02_FULL_39_14]
MKHRVFGKKLNRDIKERKALFRNLINSLIIYGRIKTTLAKAKAIKSLIEKLVTKAKDGSRSQVNQIASFLTRKEPVKKLVNEIAPRFKDKIGGYIRMVRIGKRQGDNAEVVMMEWTAPPAPQTPLKPASAKSTDKKNAEKPKKVKTEKKK